MKLNAVLNDEQHTINIRQEGDKLVAEIDDVKYELEANEVSKGIYLLKYEGRVYECRVERDEKQKDKFNVQLNNNTFTISLHDPKRMRGKLNVSEVNDGVAEIITQMPGKVVRLLVEKDAEVKVGDGVIVVEAMKMQNEMKSPKDGIVKEIRVKAGDTVNGGDVLVIIE